VKSSKVGVDVKMGLLLTLGGAAQAVVVLCLLPSSGSISLAFHFGIVRVAHPSYFEGWDSTVPSRLEFTDSLTNNPVRTP
jgi:hypothetical protein